MQRFQATAPSAAGTARYGSPHPRTRAARTIETSEAVETPGKSRHRRPLMFFAACVVILCFIVPAVAVWLGIESLDRSPRPSEWYS